MTITATADMKKAILDLRGKTITAFITNELVRELRQMEVGDSVKLIVDHYEAIDHDLHAWSRITGNGIQVIEKRDKFQLYEIQKLEEFKKGRGFAMTISSQALDELIAPLGFAWAAAAIGLQVHIYFQGPAVRILKKGYKEKLRGVFSVFSGLARKDLSKIGHIPPQNKILEMEKLGAKFYLCQPSMDRFGVKKSDLILRHPVIAEYVTFLEVLQDADITFFT